MSDHNQGLGVGLICKGVCVQILFGDTPEVGFVPRSGFLLQKMGEQ